MLVVLYSERKMVCVYENIFYKKCHTINVSGWNKTPSLTPSNLSDVLSNFWSWREVVYVLLEVEKKISEWWMEGELQNF